MNATNGRNLRVAVIGGGWPADTSHLRELARCVDLRFHHSSWLPAHQVSGLAGPSEVDSRTYRPLVRSKRGHLTFVLAGLHRGLDAQSPDVVHVISEPWGLISVQAARWVRANPSAQLVMHGCDTIWNHGGIAEKYVRRRLVKRTLNVAGAYAAENTKALRLAEQNGLRSGALSARIHTNPRDSAIWHRPSTDERRAAREALGLDEETVAVGFSGRLVAQKGVAVLVDAAEQLIASDFPGRFFIAGSGPLEGELRARGAEGVELLGSLEHPGGVRQLLHALDIFTCPSLITPEWEDQGPRALLEAMMCGVMPVATNTGGIPEMLGGHGVLTEGVDAQALADGLQKAATMCGDANSDILARYAASLYSEHAAANQMLELWNSIAAGRLEP